VIGWGHAAIPIAFLKELAASLSGRIGALLLLRFPVLEAVDVVRAIAEIVEEDTTSLSAPVKAQLHLEALLDVTRVLSVAAEHDDWNQGSDITFSDQLNLADVNASQNYKVTSETVSTTPAAVDESGNKVYRKQLISVLQEAGKLLDEMVIIAEASASTASDSSNTTRTSHNAILARLLRVKVLLGEAHRRSDEIEEAKAHLEDVMFRLRVIASDSSSTDDIFRSISPRSAPTFFPLHIDCEGGSAEVNSESRADNALLNQAIASDVIAFALHSDATIQLALCSCLQLGPTTFLIRDHLVATAAKEAVRAMQERENEEAEAEAEELMELERQRKLEKRNRRKKNKDGNGNGSSEVDDGDDEGSDSDDDEDEDDDEDIESATPRSPVSPASNQAGDKAKARSSGSGSASASEGQSMIQAKLAMMNRKKGLQIQSEEVRKSLLATARAQLVDARELFIKIEGEKSIRAVDVDVLIGDLLRCNGAIDEAKMFYDNALQVIRSREDVDSEHLRVAHLLNGMSIAVFRSSEKPEGFAHLGHRLSVEAHGHYRRLLPEDHPLVMASMISLGECLERCELEDDALTVYESTLEIAKQIAEGVDHSQSNLLVMSALGVTFEEGHWQGQLARGIQKLPKKLPAIVRARWREEKKRRDNERIRRAVAVPRIMLRIAALHTKLGRLTIAEAMFQDAVLMLKDVYGV
jgi:tetratricopeptide (TPR) repeat protein